jgi:superfamily II DNA or RNA helicase
MRIIKSSQYWLNEDQIKDVEEFKEKFTFTPKYKDVQPVPTYTVADWFINDGEVERWYGFPRNYEVDFEGVEIEDRTTIGESIDVPFLGEMWEYQEPIILDFADRLHKGYTDLILSADTGSGKTVMLLKMWSMLKVPALVIVPKSDLMNQWVDRIKQFTGLEDSDIGIARQKVCEYKNKKIVVGMIHSLCKDKYPVSFKEHFGLVIFDELHKLGAFTFSQVGGMFPARYRLGATATLRRADGLASVFYSHLGRKVIRPLRGEQPIPKIIVVKYPKSSGKIPHWANSKVKRRGVLFSLLAKNAERVDWIANLTNDLYQTERQTLVLGERIAQLHSIKAFLLKKYGVNEKDIGIYIGKTSANERKRIAKNCKIILATTSMMSLGTDIPTLRGLVFATPLADVEQPIGRVCRICAGTDNPIVVDFVDTQYGEAYGWFQGRLKLYGKKKWEVVYA